VNDKDILRFCQKVEQTDLCWSWTGGRDSSGYGVFALRNRHRGSHRLIWEYLHGPIPDGLVIDHICHNRACVNPFHMRLATRKQNAENRLQHSNNTSGYRGVSWQNSNKKWRAQLRHDGVNIFLGYFDDAKEAAAVAQAKRNELFTFNDADRLVQS